MSRVNRNQLLEMANALSPLERQITETVNRFDLLDHSAIHSLFFSPVPVNGGRGRRALLARLVELDVLARLERRVGGKRAGSAGYIYRLGPVGQRLVAYWQGEGLPRGRRVPEPGSLFVRHKLSVAGIYVDLVDAERAGLLEILGFETEPDCWRTYAWAIGATAFVKPDAFARIGQGAYEDRLFIESDLGTEGSGALSTKLKAYLDYFRSGQEQADHGVFPRVLWLVPDEARQAMLVDLCGRLSADDWSLFAVVTRQRLIDFVTDLAHDDHDDELAGMEP